MSPRVIIVGGGIVGAATAWRLAKDGAAVTLLEAAKLGHGASIASFAWLNSSNKLPFEYHALNVSGMNEYHRLQAELGDDSWLHWCGHVEWYGDDQGPQRLHKKAERLQNWGYSAELLPISELGALEPDLLAPLSIEEFAYYPAEGYVDPLGLIGRLAGAARDSGAVARENTPVDRLLFDGSRVTGVETATGEQLLADVVVSCTGSFTADFLRPAGLDVPMAPAIGMVAISAPSAVRLHSIHHDELMHIRPERGGRVMMRHTDFDERVQHGQPVDERLLVELRERVATVLPAIAGVPVETARVAIRPIPGDQHSVVGPAPGVDGLYVIVAHSAITLGPFLARLAANEVLGADPDPRVGRFRPDRFID